MLHDFRERSHMSPGQYGRSNAVGIFPNGSRNDLRRCLVQARVADFHTRVTQRSRGYLRSSIMTVGTGLGHDDPQW